MAAASQDIARTHQYLLAILSAPPQRPLVMLLVHTLTRLDTQLAAPPACCSWRASVWPVCKQRGG